MEEEEKPKKDTKKEIQLDLICKKLNVTRQEFITIIKYINELQ